MSTVFKFAEDNGIGVVIKRIEILGTETITFRKNGQTLVFDTWQVKEYPQTTVGMLKRYFGIWGEK